MEPLIKKSTCIHFSSCATIDGLPNRPNGHKPSLRGQRCVTVPTMPWFTLVLSLLLCQFSSHTLHLLLQLVSPPVPHPLVQVLSFTLVTHRLCFEVTVKISWTKLNQINTKWQRDAKRHTIPTSVFKTTQRQNKPLGNHKTTRSGSK